jgi:hypothetical protein
MLSPSTQTTHELLIQSETYNPDGSATFTGLWGKQNNGGVPITDGALAFDATGVHITFTWAGNHSFDGHITNGVVYQIAGLVTVTGGGGPGFIYGQQNLVPDLSGVNFAMTSLSNGTPHQLQITKVTYSFNGTASFTGVWDGGNGPGVAVSDGTLTQDANGTHILFDWGGNHSFDGYITLVGGVWHIDGQVTVAGGGGPGHVVGSQV